MAWSYGGWRRESTSTAQRTMLILHIEEVEALLSSYKSLGAMSQQASRFELEATLARLEKHLENFNDALGLGLDADIQPFVQAKPIADDSLEIA